MTKTQIRLGPASGFFKDPYPTLLFIGPGKIWPIKVWSDWVSAGQTFIAIPTHKHLYLWSDHRTKGT